MSRRDGMRVQKCGCIIYDVGPPCICETHQRKQKDAEEVGLRKAACDQAARLGHSLTRFKEYESRRGKWTAYCTECGAVVIVYDEIPEAGDQLSGHPLVTRCKKSALLAGLAGVEA